MEYGRIVFVFLTISRNCNLMQRKCNLINKEELKEDVSTQETSCATFAESLLLKSTCFLGANPIYRAWRWFTHDLAGVAGFAGILEVCLICACLSTCARL